MTKLAAKSRYLTIVLIPESMLILICPSLAPQLTFTKGLQKMLLFTPQRDVWLAFAKAKITIKVMARVVDNFEAWNLLLTQEDCEIGKELESSNGSFAANDYLVLALK